jgi:hypothetical protein
MSFIIYVLIYFIILYFTIMFFYVYYNKNNKNNINNNKIDLFNNTTGKQCIDCYKKSFGQCLDCFNCGYCDNKCISGNIFGPSDKKIKCKRWFHNDDYINIKYFNQ